MKNCLILSLFALGTISAEGVAENQDFGDAPPPYPTLLAHNGARHGIGNLYLGAGVDSETNGWPSSDCIGDDVRGTNDDEDGVVLGPLISGRTAHVTVVASASGRVDGWADFNRDGAWTESERIFASQSVSGGTNRFTFRVPAGIAGGYVYVRIRLSSAGGLTPTGSAPDGEVEDYQVYVRQASGWQPQLSIGALGQNLALNWQTPEAAVQQADSFDGPWTTLPDVASPYVLGRDAARKFFRLRLRGESGFDVTVREADLIFDGVVTHVVCRDSSVNQMNPRSYPHTFVTFRVEQIFKGRIQGEELTLRFLGGRSETSRRSLWVSHTPRFSVGERTILFVYGNGEWATPLLPKPEGGLRVIDDIMFNRDGQRMLWTEEAKVAFTQPYSEVAINRVGNTTQQVADQSDSPSRSTLRPIQGLPMSRNQFAALLAELIELVHTPEELASLPIASSPDPAAPFYVTYGRPVPPESSGSPALEQLR